MLKHSLIIISLVCIVQLAKSQSDNNVINGEYIVQLAPNTDITSLLPANSGLQSRAKSFSHDILSNDLNISKLTIFNSSDELSILNALKSDARILAIQKNRRLTLRKFPNDPLLSTQQWQYKNLEQPGTDFNIDKAWDITTGGVSALGDTIVVCVIDDGASLHEDLVDNLWKNYKEIPNDGIDNDGNGFKDDFQGYSFDLKNDQVITNARHGTSVAGIVGAKGNNGIGVSGVNWNVKIMVVDMGEITEANAIASYSYPLAMRKLYNATNGKKGAFVVATNSSWGIDRGNPETSTIWCSIYDSLGAAGILNCAATANANINVDTEGDLPTACGSDFIVSVTNLNRQNIKVGAAGFGKKSIDIGAYGDRTYNISSSNRYAEFDGTSAATPHVTGAIALAYSVPCGYIAAYAKRDPAGAARYVKNLVLASSKSNESLATTTLSGGVLDIGEFVKLTNDLCKSCSVSDVDIKKSQLIEGGLSLYKNNDLSKVDIRIRQAGTTAWKEYKNISNGFTIPDIGLCTDFEYQIQHGCADTILKPYKVTDHVTSFGCCGASVNLTSLSLDKGVKILNTSSNLTEESSLEYRINGSDTWLSTRFKDSVTINGLTPCNLINYRVKNFCLQGRTTSPLSVNAIAFTNCGKCTATTYCDVNNFDNDSEWITSVKIGETLWQSQKENKAFGTYLGYNIPQLKREERVPLAIKPSFTGTEYREHFVGFIDYNQNGIFSPDEQVFKTSSRTLQFLDTISISKNAQLGITRMRIMMSFDAIDNPCSTNEQFGEVEDYCVEIIQSTSTQNTLLKDISLENTIFTDKILLIGDGFNLPMTFSLLSINGKLVYTSKIERSNQNNLIVNVPQDLASNMYILSIRNSDGDMKSFRVIKLP